jgi:hypothetical protein
MLMRKAPKEALTMDNAMARPSIKVKKQVHLFAATENLELGHDGTCCGREDDGILLIEQSPQPSPHMQGPLELSMSPPE